MTVSRSSALALVAAVALLGGCLTPAGAPPKTAFHPTPHVSAPPPDVADRAAVKLARAALIGSREEAERALARVGKIETILSATEEKPTGLFAVSRDLTNTTLDDPRAYRRATLALLDDDALDPALRARLERYSANDPLTLANDRVRDDVVLEVARAFNALAEPIGQSITNVQSAPYRLGRSVVNYAVQVYGLDPLPLRRRQALALWKEFLARHPDAPERETLEPRIAHADQKLARTRRDRALRVAKRALEHGRVRLALVYADRAARYLPEDDASAELREEAAGRLVAIRDSQARSLEASQNDPTLSAPVESRDIARALLLPGGDLRESSRRLLRADPDGALADEARFIAAFALGEAGDEPGMWRALEHLADEDGTNMQRHAAALTTHPKLNTWRSFRETRNHHRVDQAKWVLFGPFFQGPRDRGLPGPLEWIVDAPALFENVGGAPVRLINLPWAESLPAARVVATAAREHLARDPHSERGQEARDWLEDYERKRTNWVAVLNLHEARPDPDLEELAELRELAAEQYLIAATREPNLALRVGMYQQLGQIYPGAHAARVAGDLARTEAEEATAQRIRLTKGFLVENPDVAGPRGLGIRPELLDGDARNAELHSSGVLLVGARAVRVGYLPPSGDDEDPPTEVTEIIDEAHLARVVSLLEERSYENMLVDPLEDVGVDARRDLYFERARLGLADGKDERATSISTYTYKGVRERYGIVRHRESILPFELVFQGSLGSMSLGAFPRLHTPRETPDAFLYR